MKINQYQEEAKRTLASTGSRLADELHMAMGMVTEAGELIDVYKKNLAYKKEIDYVNLKEELGDILWYIANLCNINDWDIEDVLEININKLKVRYPEKFTQENAINRNLEEERKTLEQ
jgi:NTP pyrophosphatase (non-canonical NTP hydrolase)